MPYSKKVDFILRKLSAKPGDRIRVRKNGVVYEGFLLPREDVDFGDSDCILLKLDNGYNVGIKYSENVVVEKLEGSVELGVFKPLPTKIPPSELPSITLLSAGGTITSRIDYYTGAVAMLFSPEEVLGVVPELNEIVRIRNAERVFNLSSEDMTYREWIKLAEKTYNALSEGDSGVIIMHGTDTMHYTSAALSFMVQNPPGPVVLVGSQRSSDRGSRDSDMNLICASHLIAKSRLREVGICMHGEMGDTYCLFIRGVKARKMHTSRRDAFRPINDLPLCKIWPDGKIVYTSQYVPNKSGEMCFYPYFEPKVALLKTYPGSPPFVLDHLVDRGYRGIVLEGTGLGHIPTSTLRKEDSWLPAVERAIEEDVIIAITSQCIYGSTNPYVYRNARLMLAAGAVYVGDMTSETCYVKLGWLLGHIDNSEEVKRLLQTNLLGEISNRIRPDTYLL